MNHEEPRASESGFKLASINEHLRLLKEECAQELSLVCSSREEAYLKAVMNVLAGLEKSLENFSEDEKHIYSPKGQEPWD